MSYSIKPFLKNYIDKKGLSKVEILVVYKRMKVYAPSKIKISSNQFESGKVINHKHKVRLNAILQKQITDIETKVLDALREGQPTKEQLSTLVKEEKIKKSALTVVDFISDLRIKLKAKVSNGRLKHYDVMSNKLEAYHPNLKFKDISGQWLNEFEAHLRSKGIEVNTLNSNMSILRAILNRAADTELIDIKQFAKYRVPKYEQKLVEYLTEEEIAEFSKIVDTIKRESYKLAGNYFLLSCYTGYRIGDAKRFNFSQMVQNDMVVLQAKKNKKIVSMPLHSRLKTVIEFVKDNPLALSEEKTREYVKEICKLAGIKKHVKFHTSRHSFAMLLMKNGFSIDETAHLLGDSIAVARIYAKIHNESLNKKVLERLG
jgi:site-specific recombinase XerD